MGIFAEALDWTKEWNIINQLWPKMKAQQDISLINLGDILDDLYQGFMRLRELRGYDITRRYGALWRVIQQRNSDFDPAMAIPETLHSI